jgi:hypothetical protein
LREDDSGIQIVLKSPNAEENHLYTIQVLIVHDIINGLVNVCYSQESGIQNAIIQILFDLSEKFKSVLRGDENSTMYLSKYFGPFAKVD